jgi:hypothetical protein
MSDGRQAAACGVGVISGIFCPRRLLRRPTTMQTTARHFFRTFGFIRLADRVGRRA